jgi:hypothetical protein
MMLVIEQLIATIERLFYPGRQPCDGRRRDGIGDSDPAEPLSKCCRPRLYAAEPFIQRRRAWLLGTSPRTPSFVSGAD